MNSRHRIIFLSIRIQPYQKRLMSCVLLIMEFRLRQLDLPDGFMALKVCSKYSLSMKRIADKPPVYPNCPLRTSQHFHGEHLC